MCTKISNLNELNPILRDEEKISEGVLGMIGRFDLKRLLMPLSDFKTRGIGLMTVLNALILSRFRGLSIYSMYKSGQMNIDENTVYRMMNHPQMNWRRLLLGVAMQFLKIVKQKGSDNKSVRCFVIDDTLIPKTGKTIEGISKVFDHNEKRCVLGFKKLVLALWDGKSLLPLDFSLHRESKDKNWGLKIKDLKRLFSKKRDDKSPSNERFKELDMEKPTVALQMLRRACKHGILADYVLMDSWFITETMIKGIREIRKGMMHVVGICKMDSRKFTVDGRELNSQAIIKLKGTCKKARHTSRKYKSEYIQVDAIYKGTPVRLFYIKYKRAKNWSLLLTTDLSLTFTKTMELYQIRWSIEVFFKECKQYLRLGQGQNTDFDGQIADAAITLITHLMLSLQLRFQAYETMGGLFRDVQNQMIQDTLHERIMKVIFQIIERLLEFLSIDVDETIEMMIACDENMEEVINLLMAANEYCKEAAKKKMVA
jgi:hypothetical protein